MTRVYLSLIVIVLVATSLAHEENMNVIEEGHHSIAAGTSYTDLSDDRTTRYQMIARHMYCMGPPMGGYAMMHAFDGFGMMNSGWWGVGSFLWMLLALGLVILVYVWIVKLIMEIRHKR